jgi:hypothetical protein
MATLSTIYYLHRRGVWQAESAFATRMAGIGGLAVLISFALGCISLAKEKPPVHGLIALFISMLSFLIYVQ